MGIMKADLSVSLGNVQIQSIHTSIFLQLLLSAFVFSVLINMELILIKKKYEDIFHYLEVKRVFNGYILL